MNPNQVRKALVPVAVIVVGFIAAKLGVDIPADQVDVIAGFLVTAYLTWRIPNED